MLQCPNCGEEFEPGDSVCAACGLGVPRQSKPSSTSDDRWTFSNAGTDSASEVKTRPTPDLTSNPPAAGYQGTHDGVQTFDNTINIGGPNKTPNNEVKGPSRRFFPTPTATQLSKSLKTKDEHFGSKAETSPQTKDNQAPPFVEDSDTSGEQDFYIETDSVVKNRATAPRLVKFRRTPPISGRSNPLLTNALSYLKTGRNRIWAFSAAVLIGTWFVPDVWAEQSLFTHDRLNLAGPWELVSLLAKPIVGCMLLAMMIRPVSNRLRALTGLSSGLFILTALFILSPASPLFEGYLLSTWTLASLLTATAVLASHKYHNLGWLIVAIVPLILVIAAFYGTVTDKLPAGNLMLFKTPLEIFAAMLISAHSAAFLIHGPRENGALDS